MSTFAAWLLTYALHSTLLLGLAWVLSRRLSPFRHAPRLEEAVWRTALLGAVATASLHVAVAGAGWQPALGSWTLDLGAPAAAAHQAPPVAAPDRAGSLAAIAASDVGLSALAAEPAAARQASPSEPARPAGSDLFTSPGAAGAMVLLWAAGTLALLARFAFAHLGLRSRLRPRLEISGGTLFRLLARLVPQSGPGLQDRRGRPRRVQLTCAHRLPVPVALGIRRPEICVPPRVLSHLDPAAQETLLAHELGHLARRDPLWLNAVALLTCVLFFQPLNWLARRRLRELSELLCDDWAVQRTGQPLTLARCLAEVAGWSLGSSRGALLPAPGMADRPGQLARRVRRLLEATPAPGSDSAERALPRWLGAAVVALLLAVVAVAPGVSAAPGEGEEAPPPRLAGTPAPPSAASEPPAGSRPGEPAGEIDRRGRPARPPAPRARGLSAAEREQIRAFRERAEALAARHDLTGEEMERQAAQLAAELERDLRPHIDEMARFGQALAESDEMRRLQGNAAAFAERFVQSPEMMRLIADSARLAEGAQLSDDELERLSETALRLSAEIQLSDEELERLQQDALRLAGQAQFDQGEIDHLREQAGRLAGEARLDPQTEADLKRLTEKMREFEREHRQELEELRRELLKMQSLGDEIRRGVERDLAPLAPLSPPGRPHAAPPARRLPPAPAPPARPGDAAPPAPPADPAAAPPPPPPADAAAPPAPPALPSRQARLAPAPPPAVRLAAPPSVRLAAPPSVRMAAPPAVAPPAPRPGSAARLAPPLPPNVVAPPAPRPGWTVHPGSPIPPPAVAPPAPRGRRSRAVVGGVAGGVPGGVEGGVTAGVEGGVAGGVEGAVADGVKGAEAEEEEAPPSL